MTGSNMVEQLVVLARAWAAFGSGTAQYSAPDTGPLQKAIVERMDSDIDLAFKRLYEEDGPSASWFGLQHAIDIIVDSPWVPDSRAEIPRDHLCQTVAFPVISSAPSLASATKRSGYGKESQPSWRAWNDSLPSQLAERRVVWTFDAFLHPGEHYFQLAASSLFRIQRDLGVALLSCASATEKPKLPSESFGEVTPCFGSPEFFLVIGVMALPFKGDLAQWPQVLADTLYSTEFSHVFQDPLFASRLEQVFGVSRLRLLPPGTLSEAIQQGRVGRRDLAFMEGVAALQESNQKFGPIHRAIIVPAVDDEGMVRAIRFSLLDTTGECFLGGVSFELIGLEPAEQAMQRLFACCEALSIGHVDSCEAPVPFEHLSEDDGFAHPTSSSGRLS